MLVSVIIPTYNRPDFLREALASVFAQTYRDFEIIVVDDGSTAETGKLLDELAGKIRAIRLDRSGISKARNTAVEAARGEFLAFLDHDDLWLPTKLEKHVAFAAAHPELTLTYTDAREFSKQGPAKITYVENLPALKNPRTLFAPMIASFAIPLMSATMVRASFLKEHNLSFPDYFGIDDLALFLIMLIRGAKFGYLPECLTMRRMHESNTSSNHRRRFEQRKWLYRDMLSNDAAWSHKSQCTAEQISALRFGLRDASYRVAECDWEDFDFPRARKGFCEALRPDLRGMHSLAYAILTLLPPKTVAGLRRMKSSV